MERGIPGSSYERAGEAQGLFLPPGGAYTVRLVGTGDGPGTLRVKGIERDVVISSTIFANFPLTPVTIGGLTVDAAAQTVGPLLLDTTGTGVFDTAVPPSVVLAYDDLRDRTPPETRPVLTGLAGNNGWYRSPVGVSFLATDAGGVGVNRTYYRASGDPGWRWYLAPFTLSQEGQMQVNFYSDDLAYNSEVAKSVSVSIDTTPPTVMATASPSVLWPPDGKMVDVRIDGSATDSVSGIDSVAITVTDEYGMVQPAVPGFGSTIQLEASRRGDDEDGRVYTITAVARDKAGNVSTATTQVRVPHDMSAH